MLTEHPSDGVHVLDAAIAADGREGAARISCLLCSSSLFDTKRRPREFYCTLLRCTTAAVVGVRRLWMSCCSAASTDGSDETSNILGYNGVPLSPPFGIISHVNSSRPRKIRF